VEMLSFIFFNYSQTISNCSVNVLHPFLYLNTKQQNSV